MDIIARPIKPLIGLDPRTKFCMLLTIAAFGFSGFTLAVELSALAVISFFLYSYRIRSFTLKMDIAFITMVTLEYLVAPVLLGWAGVIFLALVKMPRIILLIIMTANLLIKTTSVSEFTAAFRKMHIPEKIIIPFSVMFRFIPTIKEEWSSIHNAMQLRGIATSAGAIAKAPMKTLEYGMIPMLMSVATISSELAAASLSRGLDTEIERSCLTEVRFALADYLVIALCISYAVLQVVY